MLDQGTLVVSGRACERAPMYAPNLQSVTYAPLTYSTVLVMLSYQLANTEDVANATQSTLAWERLLSS